MSLSGRGLRKGAPRRLARRTMLRHIRIVVAFAIFQLIIAFRIPAASAFPMLFLTLVVYCVFGLYASLSIRTSRLEEALDDGDRRRS